MVKTNLKAYFHIGNLNFAQFSVFLILGLSFSFQGVETHGKLLW